jgi:galactokinase
LTSEATSKLNTLFAELFGGHPAIYRAPGRVNLIGEHTDYSDGFVMPAALALNTYVAVRPRAGRLLRVYSETFGEMRDLDLDLIRPGKSGHWSDYVRGVAAVLESSGYKLRGADLAIMSEVPLGSGLSSSAALEVSTALALLSSSQIGVDLTTVAKLCQQAEHLYPETMWNYGPVHLLPRSRGTRSDVGLSFARSSDASHSIRGAADGLQYDGSP